MRNRVKGTIRFNPIKSKMEKKLTIREIRILDLKEAKKNITGSQTDGDEWFRELTAIDNAIKFLEDLD